MAEKFYSKFVEKKTKKPDKTDKKEKAVKKEKPAVIEKAPKKSEEKASPYKPEGHLFAANKLPAESVKILNDFDTIIQGVRPLNSRQLQQLPENIRNLSHQLTDQRSERRLGYMNDNIQLSSYVRYYTWWNLVRLTRLFSNLPSRIFPSSDCVCLDLGSGPLTVVTALWLARPELRKLKLTWYCLDVSSNSMALGEDVFLSVVARTSAAVETSETPWNIIRVKGPFGTSIKQKCDFITCANMFNELDQAGNKDGKQTPEFLTKKYFEQLKNYAGPKAGFLLVEPGVPKAARTVSLLRDRFIGDGRTIVAPCPHAADCPMNGFSAYTGSKNKWCNFAFSTEDAPAKLQKLSELAKLPKERATLSFVAAVAGLETQQTDAKENLLCRVASDSFRLPGYRTGHYACTEFGLALLRSKNEQTVNSGDLISVKIKKPDSLPKDEKSGALIIDL